VDGLGEAGDVDQVKAVFAKAFVDEPEEAEPVDGLLMLAKELRRANDLLDVPAASA
jgi:hypothetical protein